MAIVTEYINYVDKDIPYIKADYLITQMQESESDYNTQTYTVNGNTFTYKWGNKYFELNSTPHFTNYYYTGEIDKINIEMAIKSKNDLPYSYIVFYNELDKYGYINLDIAITKNKNEVVQGDFGLANVSMGDEGNSRFCILEVGKYIGIARTWDATNAYNQPLGVGCKYCFVEKKVIEDVLGTAYERTYDTEFGGISDADGYNPDFDNSSDIITIPNMPTIGVSNVGFINVYNTSQNALQNLGADLFPDFTPPPTPEPSEDLATTIAMGFSNVVDNLSNLLNSYINSNLINYIIDCHCLPVTPTTGESENIKIGFKQFNQIAQRITSDYVDFDCGTLNIKEYYGNFIDYVGTRASLYLPFIGFVPIKNEYFQSGALSVKYRFNIIDGSFMCYVLATSSKSNLKDTVIGTYSGNACVHIPITGVNYSNMVSGLLNSTTAIVSASKGVGGVAVSSALNTLSMKPEMQGNNSYNSTSSFIGIRYPYLLIEREVSNFSELYPNEYGLPLNVTKTISELTGYIEMDENIHIEVNCMNEEKEMLKELLTGGIII